MYSRINMDYDKIPIDGFPDYYVDIDGNVYSNKYQAVSNRYCEMRLLKPIVKKNGYLQYSLCKNGKRYWKLGHRLVGDIFVPNPRPDIFTELDHIDGIKTNNAWTNLRWVPQWFNQMYYQVNRRQVRTTTIKRGNQSWFYYTVSYQTKDNTQHREHYTNKEDAEVFNNKIKEWVMNWEGDKVECQEVPDFVKLFLD